MIEVKRDGDNVELDFTINVPGYDRRNFIFKWLCNDPVYAGLLSTVMSNEFFKTIQLVRKEAYENGWKDAKAKRTKKVYFLGYLR